MPKDRATFQIKSVKTGTQSNDLYETLFGKNIKVKKIYT